MVLCYKVALEHWQQGRVSKSLEWGWLRTQKEEWTIPVWLFVFIACNFKQFHFLLLHGSVCVKGSHRANNGKQRTRLPGDLSFIKTSSHKGHIRLKLVIIMIRPKSAKLQTPIKFFFLSLRASGMMLSIQMVRFQTRSLLRISLTLQFNPSRVY